MMRVNKELIQRWHLIIQGVREIHPYDLNKKSLMRYVMHWSGGKLNPKQVENEIMRLFK